MIPVIALVLGTFSARLARVPGVDALDTGALELAGAAGLLVSGTARYSAVGMQALFLMAAVAAA